MHQKHRRQQTEEFLNTFYRISTIDHISILLNLTRRLVFLIAGPIPKLPFPIYLASTQILIFFAYTLLLDIDAWFPWTIIFVVYAASLSTTVFLWSLIRVPFYRFLIKES